MLLRNRILGLFGGVTLLVGIAVSAPAVLILGDSEQRLESLRQNAQTAAWREALNQAAQPLTAMAREVEVDAEIEAALRSGSARALRERLGTLHKSGLEGRGARRLEVVSPTGELAAAAPAQLDSNAMASAAAEGVGLAQATGGGALMLVASVPTPAGWALSVAADAAPLATALAASLGTPFLILDRNRAPLVASQDGLWPALRPVLAGAPSGVGLLETRIDGRPWQLVLTPLIGVGGNFLGDLVTLRDAGVEVGRRTLVLLLAGGVGAVVILGIAVVLYRTIRGTLDPLTEVAGALKSVAGGDIYASAAVRPRSDEVGAIAGALEEVRASGLALDRLQTRERLQDLRERAVIRGQVMRLADVLVEPARGEVVGMLRAADQPQGLAPGGGQGGTLARAFSHMSDLVIGQHGRLKELLEERTRDLEVVRQALAERTQLNRMREELEVARNLQLSSLPTNFPDRPEFQLFASTLPAKEVGGDFYDFVMLDESRLALCIGDAAGKGVPAAMFIAMTRSLLRAALVRGAGPAEALAQANDVLSIENPSAMFATVFVAVLDLPSGRMVFASAGHNPPRLRRASGGEGLLHGQLGPALGVMEGLRFRSGEAVLHPGDTLLTYTDGVTEAFGPGDALFGDDRLAALMQAEALPAGHQGGPNAAQALVEQVGRAVDVFADGEPQADDITMLCLVVGTNA